MTFLTRPLYPFVYPFIALSGIIICCALIASISQAEPTVPGHNSVGLDREGRAALTLSVEEAVLFALQNNRDLRVRQYEPLVAGTFEDIERGQFDTELFAEAEYFEEESTETSRSTGAQFSVIGTETSQQVGLEKFFPTGTTLEAIASHERSTSNRAPEQQEARLELTVTQSLLQGFGPAANLAGVRQAELETTASINQLRGYIEALLAETETAYWQYVLAKEEIAIFEKSLDIARQQLEEVELRIDVGILPEIEAAAAKAEKALRIQALIEARSLLEERRLRLLRLLNATTSGRLDRQVKTTSDPRIEAIAIADKEDRLRLANKSRPDLKEAQLRLQQNRLETIVTRKGLLPRLDLFITLGKTGFADSFSDSVSEIDGETYDFTAGVRLSHYLGDRAAKARNLAAYASYQQASDAIMNLRQLVELDVLLAINEVEKVRQQIEASRTTRILQELTMNAEKERFDVGASTALDVALAQRDFLRSQINEIESIVNYRIALVKLYLAEGSLLDRRGITIDEGFDDLQY